MTIHETIPVDIQLAELMPTAALPETHETTLDVELMLCHNPESDAWKQAEAVEAAVFIEKGYVTDQAEMAADYEQYTDATRMIVARQGSKVVGCARVISYDSEIGFKTTNDALKGQLDISLEGWKKLGTVDPRTILEVGALCLEKEFRTRRGADEHMVTSLYGGVYALVMQDGTPNVMASFDEEYHGRFKGLFGPYVVELGEAKEYMGSKTVVSIMNSDEIEAYFVECGAQSFVDELTDYSSKIQREY